MAHLRGGKAIFRGGELPPLLPPRKNPARHLIEISELTHAARITKNRQNRKVCSQEKVSSLSYG